MFMNHVCSIPSTAQGGFSLQQEPGEYQERWWKLLVWNVCVGETLLWLLSVYFTCCDVSVVFHVSVCNFTPVNDYASVVLMQYDYQIYLGWIRGFAGEVEATKDLKIMTSTPCQIVKKIRCVIFYHSACVLHLFGGGLGSKQQLTVDKMHYLLELEIPAGLV